MKNTPSLKDAAVAFLKMASGKKVEEAYAAYVAPTFRHHNAHFKGDAASLLKGMQENAAQFPEKVLDVKLAVQEGDLVVTYSHVRLKPGDRGLAVMHIFRFEQGRVAELWDMGQAVPENSPNEYGMF